MRLLAVGECYVWKATITKVIESESEGERALLRFHLAQAKNSPFCTL